MPMQFSLIIPIFNRPDEIDELLESLSKQTYSANYEIVIIEDGSTITCEHIIKKYVALNVSYYFKPNSGPGDSRNFCNRRAWAGSYMMQGILLSLLK